MIYLDNAATTFPKPEKVLSAVNSALTRYGGNPGRGSHKLSLEAAEKVFECREEAAQLFGASCAERIIFTLNTTYALNTAIKAVVRPGDHVLISSMEHNSVFRPVRALADHGIISFSVFDAFSSDPIEEINRLIRKNTRLVVCAHASNICGKILPIGRIGRLLRGRKILFIVDGAQSAGKIDLNVERDCIDALCVPGHKGLYGPQGCGLVVAGESFGGSTLVEGGGGINSLDERMPDFLPERFEAGTLPTPAIIGLTEGIRFVREIGTETICEKESRLFSECSSRLNEISAVTQYSRDLVVLFNVNGISAPELCDMLSREGFCVRGGFHCAPLAHRSLCTGAEGAVRVSFGFFNTRSDVIRLCDAIRRIVKTV